ncbi:hypothetical protein I4U23_000433 [Adineta vaga]|nr:hypothetical protein I4U23_000433 [Adineta vaga]
MIFRNKSSLFIISIILGLLIFLFITQNQYPMEFTYAPLDSKENFTCETWKAFSYINIEDYRKCLTWKPDESFWPIQGMRHTIHQNLLNSSSLIVELGGNIGTDIMEFMRLYNSSIISFEPIRSMAMRLKAGFRAYPTVEIRPYGLGNRARNLTVELFDSSNAGTSMFRELSGRNSTYVQIQILDIIEVINHIRKTRTQNGIIDMLTINCEGCEFEVLPALILNNMIQYFRIIQFGSHTTLVSQSTCIYCQIQQALRRTHKIRYHFTMLWEGWILK